MRATSMLEDQRLRPGGGLWWLSLITCSGASGWIVAHRVQMTEAPACRAKHSLVGLAAVFIGFNAHVETVSYTHLTLPTNREV